MAFNTARIMINLRKGLINKMAKNNQKKHNNRSKSRNIILNTCSDT